MARYRIVEHYNKENGHFMGYSLQYKPFPFIPYWREPKYPTYSSQERLEHDLCWFLKLDGIIAEKSEYH
jgi:hypothetical protein